MANIAIHVGSPIRHRLRIEPVDVGECSVYSVAAPLHLGLRIPLGFVALSFPYLTEPSVRKPVPGFLQ
jgi:hypothetical protein